MAKWKHLLFVCAFMLVFALVFQSIPPLVGFLVADLGITHAQAGALMSLFGLPGIFISIPGGILSDLHGAKRVGVAALAITLVGSLLVALGGSFSLLLTGRIIAGIGALTISIAAPQALSRSFQQKDMGKAMGIFNAVMPLGTILTLNTFGRLADRAGWRAPLLLASFYTLLMLFLFSFKYSDPPRQVAEKAAAGMGESAAYLGRAGSSVWLLGIIWLL